MRLPKNSFKGVSVELTIWQRIQIKLVGQAFLRWEKPEGYSAAVPMFAVKCEKHGPFKDNPHGFSNHQYFVCPKSHD